MSEHIPEVEEHAEGIAPEVPVVEPETHVETAPDWQEPLARVEASVQEISEKLAAITNPANPEPITEVVEPDESPVKKPWTHRNPFGKS